MFPRRSRIRSERPGLPFVRCTSAINAAINGGFETFHGIDKLAESYEGTVLLKRGRESDKKIMTASMGGKI
jgi:hypothetical protein